MFLFSISGTPPFAIKLRKFSIETKTEKTGGVFNIDSFSICCFRSKYVGMKGEEDFPRISSFTMYKVAPAGPRFF